MRFLSDLLHGKQTATIGSGNDQGFVTHFLVCDFLNEQLAHNK